LSIAFKAVAFRLSLCDVAFARFFLPFLFCFHSYLRLVVIERFTANCVALLTGVPALVEAYGRHHAEVTPAACVTPHNCLVTLFSFCSNADSSPVSLPLKQVFHMD
jgi:hypothetical protein